MNRSTPWARFAGNRAATISLAFLVLLSLAAVLAPWITPYDPNAQSIGEALQGPSVQHWLGTDEVGRDVATRILYGARLSLLCGITAVAAGLAVALPLGLISGYFGGAVDLGLQRIVDTLFALPGFLLALALAAILGTGMINLIVAVSVSIMPAIARLVRSGTLEVKSQNYVENAVSVGCSRFRVLYRHVLPNMIGPIVVQSTLYVGTAIVIAAGLGFLGLGIQMPTAEWGTMLGTARAYMFNAPLLIAVPGLFIFATVLAFNYFGDGLGDALDPRRRG